MSISFGGVGSGLPVNDWINALVQAEAVPIDRLRSKSTELETSKTNLNSIKAKFSSLRTSVEKFTDANIISSFDLFAKKKATVSDTALLKATVSSDTVVQDFTMKISQLATSTIAQSSNTPGKISTGSTKITELNNYTGKNGTFSIILDNQKHTFELTGADGSKSLQDVIDKINTEFSGGEVVASLDVNGYFKLEVDNSVQRDIDFGSSTDTSNIFNVLGLKKDLINDSQPATPTNIDYFISSKPLSSINIHGKLSSNEANLNTAVTTGTFNIGEEEFTIDENSTISSILSEINSRAEAGVTASYDIANNKFMLKAKEAGAITIDIKAGTSNFTTAMGLTNGANLATGSQTLGNNALFELNGENYEASTNVVTEDITGVKGFTFNLLGTTSEEEGKTSEININIQQNTDDLTNAIDDFIKKFNELTSDVNKNATSGGKLRSEFSLVRLQSDLRMSTMGRVSGLSTYNNLGSVGISTGSVGTSVSENTNSLKLDKDKFLEALSKNPSEVRALFVGDKEKGITGIMQKLEKKVESSLDVENGYFAARTNSFNNMIEGNASSVKKREDALEAYRVRLVQQFSQMDQYISKMKQQSAALY